MEALEGLLDFNDGIFMYRYSRTKMGDKVHIGEDTSYELGVGSTSYVVCRCHLELRVCLTSSY